MGPRSAAIFAVEMFCEQPRAKGHVRVNMQTFVPEPQLEARPMPAGNAYRDRIRSLLKSLSCSPGIRVCPQNFMGLALRLKLRPRKGA
jgi:hypothetical protein